MALETAMVWAADFRIERWGSKCGWTLLRGQEAVCLKKVVCVWGGVGE